MKSKPKKTSTPKKPRTAKAAVSKTKTKTKPKSAKAKPAPAASKPHPQDQSKSQTEPPASIVPPALLEADLPAPSSSSGPGHRYSLDPNQPEPVTQPPPDPDLPEAYGTSQLMLAATAPHWLYAYWDFTLDQLRHFIALARHDHLFLRLFQDQSFTQPIAQVELPPDTRQWFLYVEQADCPYVAELGYYDPEDQWNVIVRSPSTFVPPESPSEDTTVRFENFPPDVPFTELLRMVKNSVTEHPPLADAIGELRKQGHTKLPEPTEVDSPQWTAMQEEALARIIHIDTARRVWIGSLEITEMLRRRFLQEAGSQESPAFSWPAPSFQEAASPMAGFNQSPPSPPAKPKPFWFNINAELVIYGATEPDAQVTLGGRPVRLRPDGTFSYRFSLPDGQYELPAVAVSADQTEARAAQLRVSRTTDYRGQTGELPPTPSLETPDNENVL